MPRRSTYFEKRAAWDEVVRACDRRASVVSSLRLVAAVAAIGLLLAIAWAHLSTAAYLVVAALVVSFGGLVVWHARLFERRAHALASRRFYDRGLARLEGRWVEFPATGERFRDTAHQYAEDLDLFGHASLFQLLDVTETTFGEDRLASLLAAPTTTPWPEAVRARQQAVRELAERLEFREQLSAHAFRLNTAKSDPNALLAWAEQPVLLSLPLVLHIAAYVLPVAALLLFALAPALRLPRAAGFVVVAVQLALTATARPAIARALAAVSSQERGLTRFAEMLGLIEREPFVAPGLRTIEQRLGTTGHRATTDMAALARIASFVEARENGAFRLLIAPVLLWDLHCAVALERWRARAGGGVRGWFGALADVEALASLAAFAYEHPGFAWPSLDGRARFEAAALGHPLIAEERRVCNDVTLAGPGSAFIVTGSNMSGKSTLLRAIGINAVLALAGAPVCAARLTIGPLEVATSMRVGDSLEQGVSRFYAELQKIKRVLDLASRKSVLFLLDEILHGTNSRERLIGARAVVRALLDRGAMGAVSTHDLEIAKLEHELAGRVFNAHFEEQVEGDAMTFDYTLRDGVVRSSNALRLMKLVGIDVVPVP